MTRRNLLLSGCGLAGAAGTVALLKLNAQSDRPARYSGPRILVKEPAVPPRHDKWRIIGPGGGGAQYFPTVSPHDPNFVMLSCDMTCTFVSENGGDTWRQINFRDHSQFFIFDPLNPAVIYVGAKSGVYRSEDRARTWNLVIPNPSGAAVRYFEDEGDTVIVGGERVGRVRALAIDPADSNQIYFAAGNVLYYSKNRLATFTDIATLMRSQGRGLYIDPRSPEKHRALYVVGTDWAAVWQNGKVRGGNAAEGRGDFAAHAIAFPQQGEPVLYGIRAYERKPPEENPAGGLSVTHDGGATWQPLNQKLLALADRGAMPPTYTALACSVSDPSVLYLSFNELHIGGKQYQGVLRSADAGSNWDFVWKESTESGSTYASNFREGWFPDRFEPDWCGNPLFLGVDPKNPNVCFGSDFGRTARTTDGGKTWQQLYTQCLEDGTYTTTGLDVTSTYGVHFDPFNKDRMFITFTDIGLFRSENRGRSWVPSNFGCPPAWRNTTYWMDFDPEVPGLMWAAMSRNHDIPRARVCCETGKFQGGVCISRDGGRSWTVSNSGMPPTAATHILLDPASPRNRRVLYATGWGRGVFKSIDGGANWALKNNGIDESNLLAWRTARDKNGVLYLVVVRRRAAQYGSPGDGALYRSTDGAENWKRLTLPAGVNGPNGIAIDPENPDRLYLANWGRYVQNGPLPPTDGGVLLSEDGGAHWQSVFSSDQHVYDVTIDPSNPSIVYATTYDAAVWRSTDRGRNWSRIPGINFKQTQRVIPDPHDPSMIYVATFGSCIWHGPATGDPGAVEDIVTPSVRFQREAPKHKA